MRRSTEFYAAAIAFATLVVVGCNDQAVAENGVIRQCRTMQEKTPEQALGGAAECQCVATKFKALLTEDHYAILNDYNAALVDVAAARPGLRGPEINARALKYVSENRSESPSIIVAEMNAFSGVTSIAYQLCSVFPAQ